jgi:hypothetical protein
MLEDHTAVPHSAVSVLWLVARLLAHATSCQLTDRWRRRAGISLPWCGGIQGRLRSSWHGGHVAGGRATLFSDLAEVRRWATVLGGRYMGADRAREYGARNGVPGEYLVRVTPAKVVARRGIAD